MIPADDHDVLRVAATTDNLDVIRVFVRERISGRGFSEFEENGIVLAVDEACSNLVLHAYGNDASRTIAVSVQTADDALHVSIADTAPPFDPNQANLPDMQSYFTEHRHGGLGILIMTRVMDVIRYDAGEDGENVLVLTKKRRP